MSLDYALMYLQLEDMNRRARVQGGIAYMKKEHHEKLSKIMNIVSFSYVGIFILVQTTVMVLTVVNVVEPKAFLVELNSLIGVLMIFLNGFALVNYCRNAGNPYLSEKNKKYVRNFKLVIILWNLAFITKFFMSSFGVNIIDIQMIEDPSQNDFWYSVETFANIMFTEIIPFWFVLDKKIIKIFTVKFLEIQDNSEMILAERSNSETSSRSSSVELEKDNEEGVIRTNQDLVAKLSPVSRAESAHSEEESLALRLTNVGHTVFQEAVIQ